VTHLPQVASQADHHFAVRKQSRRGQVETTIEQVAGAARVEEIARMAGGVRITDQALAHAAAMIDRSGAAAEAESAATRPSAGAGRRGAGTRRK